MMGSWSWGQKSPKVQGARKAGASRKSSPGKPMRVTGPKMRIFGLDPGSNVVGFACIEARIPASGRALTLRDFRIVDVGVLKANQSASHAKRIAALHIGLHDLLQGLKPDMCVVERAFAGVNAMSALKLGEARGALVSAIGRLDLPMHEVTPASAKKLISGHGAATKEEVSLSIQALTGFQKGQLPYDATDALALALCGGLEVIQGQGGRRGSSAATIQETEA